MIDELNWCIRSSYMSVTCFNAHINVFTCFPPIWEKYLICFFLYSGEVLNHLGHVREENMPFFPNNGRGSLHQMEGSAMVEPSFWRKFAVEYVIDFSQT